LANGQPQYLNFSFNTPLMDGQSFEFTATFTDNFGDSHSYLCSSTYMQGKPFRLWLRDGNPSDPLASGGGHVDIGGAGYVQEFHDNEGSPYEMWRYDVTPGPIPCQLTPIPDPGYIFDGWYTDQMCNQLINRDNIYLVLPWMYYSDIYVRFVPQ